MREKGMDQGLGQAGTGLLVVNVHGTVLRCHRGILSAFCSDPVASLRCRFARAS